MILTDKLAESIFAPASQELQLIVWNIHILKLGTY